MQRPLTNKVTRCEFVSTALAATAIAAVAPSACSQPTPRRPNILFILADIL
jgi:hypothetical protein